MIFELLLFETTQVVADINTYDGYSYLYRSENGDEYSGNTYDLCGYMIHIEEILCYNYIKNIFSNSYFYCGICGEFGDTYYNTYMTGYQIKYGTLRGMELNNRDKDFLLE